MTGDAAVARRPGRPRDPQADALILQAAHDELVASGFGGFTVDAVASRAGVGKATIYRRWPSREELVLGAARVVIENHEVPDTGHVRSDLVQYFSRAYKDKASGKAAEFSGVFPALVAEAAVNPDLKRLLQEFLEERRSATRQIVARGVARGELSSAIDTDLFIDMMSGPLLYRSALSERPVDADVVAVVVDAALRGVGAREA